MKTEKLAARRDRGVALILALLVLAILVVVVVQFSYTVRVETRIVQNGLEDQEMSVAVRGVFPYLGTLFRDDAKDPNPTIQNADGFCDNWDDPHLADKLHQLTVGDVQLQFRVEDCERRFPLEWLADDIRSQWALQVFTKLLGKLAVDKPDDVALKIANKVRDLAGKQALAAPGAPGTPPPLPAPPAPPPLQPGQQPIPRRAILDVEELLAVEGVDGIDKIIYGDPNAQPVPKKALRDFVTCWPTAGINLNTCSYELLVSLLPTQGKAPPGQPGQPGQPGAGQQIDVEALSKKIRAHRIDPVYEAELAQGGQNGQPPPPPPPPPPAPPGQGGTPGNGSGASKSWSATSKSFQQVSELGQFDELKGYFANAAPGQPGAPPPPPPPTGQPQPQLTAANFDFTTALVTTSRFYAVWVQATAPSGNTKVVRLVLERSKQNVVSPLMVREQPR